MCAKRYPVIKNGNIHASLENFIECKPIFSRAIINNIFRVKYGHIFLLKEEHRIF